MAQNVLLNKMPKGWKAIENATGRQIAKNPIQGIIEASRKPIIATLETAQDAFNSSQASADKAMQFSAAQAAQQMAFQKAMMENMQSYNSAQAREQRNWQEQMRATAYQATVKDMITAGINPILAAQLGATSAGSGATATSGMAQGAMGSSAQAHMEQQTVPQLIRAAGYMFKSAKEAANAFPKKIKKEMNKDLFEWLKIEKRSINAAITPPNMKGR